MKKKQEKLKLEDIYSYPNEKNIDNWQPYHILGKYSHTVVKGSCPSGRCGTHFYIHKSKVTDNTEEDVEKLFAMQKQKRRMEKWQKNRVADESFEDWDIREFDEKLTRMTNAIKAHKST